MGNDKAKLLRAVKLFALAVTVMAAAIPGYALLLRFTGNFHVVEQGALYRSAQPSESDIKRYAQDFGIRTIINLRDFSPGQRRADDDEMHVAQEMGLNYVRYPLSASRMLTAAQIADIIKMMADRPRPILVHSYFGSDRAGLASALYLYAIGGKSAKEASSQLSPSFGHLPYLRSSTAAMDDTLVAVVNVGSPNTPTR